MNSPLNAQIVHHARGLISYGSTVGILTIYKEIAYRAL